MEDNETKMEDTEKENEGQEMDGNENNEGEEKRETLDCSVQRVKGGIPKEAMVKGLFPGSIPKELVDLTHVELSMISIYSAVTKVCILGGGVDFGKHYNADGGVNYTIINDLAAVCDHLPKMPTAETSATMRHNNGVRSKDYTYRPYRVEAALRWLKKNNHLYADIPLIYPSDWPENPDELLTLDAPFIELSDTDLQELDEDIAIHSVGQPPSTNSGMNVHY